MGLTGKSPTLMSPPKPVLELTGLAKSDFRDILSYTWQMWGDRQVDTYRDIIDHALRAIANDPETGQKLSGSNYRFSRAGKHLIFFRLDGARILVVRILHAKMDFGAHCPAPIRNRSQRQLESVFGFIGC
jgi:toxin ParE1/3/4